MYFSSLISIVWHISCMVGISSVSNAEGRDNEWSASHWEIIDI